MPIVKRHVCPHCHKPVPRLCVSTPKGRMHAACVLADYLQTWNSKHAGQDIRRTAEGRTRGIKRRRDNHRTT